MRHSHRRQQTTCTLALGYEGCCCQMVQPTVQRSAGPNAGTVGQEALTAAGSAVQTWTSTTWCAAWLPPEHSRSSSSGAMLAHSRLQLPRMKPSSHWQWRHGHTSCSWRSLGFGAAAVSSSGCARHTSRLVTVQQAVTPLAASVCRWGLCRSASLQSTAHAADTARAGHHVMPGVSKAWAPSCRSASPCRELPSRASRQGCFHSGAT